MFRREVDSIPVLIDGVPVANPFVGGFSSSKPALIDIDSDSDLDLFVGEASGKIFFYRNTGTAANPAFTLITESFASVDVGAFSAPCFTDIDNDADFDLLVGELDGNINFYRNTGTAINPTFTLVTANFSSIDVGDDSAPTLADIDNDGDFDLLVGEGSGNINFYRNTGSATNPAFSFVTENFVSAVGRLSAPAFADIDGDRDFDLFSGVGGLGYGSIYFYPNIGNATSPAFNLLTTGFSSINVGDKSTPAFADIDNDGDFDMFIGEDDGNLNFYRNTGTAANFAFTFVTGNLTHILDVGFNSIPTFTDIDNDGDFDLFAGEARGTISYFRNTGTATSPEFSFVTNSFAAISVGILSAPVFADIDNDGDADLFVGEYGFGGNINFYRNTGTPANPTLTLETANFDSIAVGSQSTPNFADIDGDGDFDLFAGEFSGNLNFYRNTGTIINSAFTLVTESFAFIDVGSESAPSLADIDNDGDFDLLVGERDGNINFHRNTGTTTTPSFSLVTDSLASADVGNNSTPSFADIDNDDDLDMFVGNSVGGIYFYRNIAAAPQNRAPVEVNPIPNQILTTGASFMRNVNTPPTVFMDPDGDALSYTANSSAINIATASISGSSLVVAPVGIGTATVTVTASDGRGGTAQSFFSVTVVSSFTEIATPLAQVNGSTAAWGDYDNDDDLDILITGLSSSGRVSKVYRNTGGNFVDIAAALVGVNLGAVAWGDYDNDGDLDILLTGNSDAGLVSKIYRNDEGNFVDIVAALTGVSFSAVAWGDYDNDGDLDILLSGNMGSNISKIYQNEAGSFADISAPITGVDDASVAWGDYDNDGDLDIVLAGDSGSGRVSNLYRNDGGNFVDIGAALTPVDEASIVWGDYDNDGDLDILLTGRSAFGDPVSKIFRNDRDNFVDIGAALAPVSNGSVAWGDYDNDGDLDILLAGISGSGDISKVYRNNGGSFIEIFGSLAAIQNGSAVWGDYDKDGDLDILLSGSLNLSRTTKIYRNNIGTTNQSPTSPTNIAASVGGNSVTLSWGKSIDSQTPQNGLTYNIRLGTTSGGVQKVSPMSNLITGYRGLAMLGNTNHQNSWMIKNLTDGTYFWSVQAIDNAFAGSVFAAEQSFTIGTVANQPPVVTHTIPNQTLTVGGLPFIRDLNAAPAVFNDPDGDVLTYAANSGAVNVATATISGSMLTIAPIAAGSTTIVATANDGRGGTAADTLNVTVTQLRVPNIAVDPPSHDYGSVPVGSNADKTFIISNTGDTTLVVNSTSFIGTHANQFTIMSGGGAFNLAPNASRNLVARFAPNAMGVKNATLRLASNDPDENPFDVALTGSAGNNPPIVQNSLPDTILTLGRPAFSRDLNAMPAVFRDPDGDPLTFTVRSILAAIATANLAGNRLTVTPVAAGTTTIIVTANDGINLPPVADTFLVTINRPPIAASTIAGQTLAAGGSPFVRDLNASPAVFNDPDGDSLRYTVSSRATNTVTTNLAASLLTVAPLAAGSDSVTITADDGKGGTVATNFEVLVNPNQPPVVTHTPIAPQPEGQAITIEASITDDGGAADARLHYRRGGDAGFSMVAMTLTSGSSYQGAIPGSAVTSRGVEYFIAASDSDNAQTRQPQTGGVFAIAVQVNNVANPSAQPGGNAQSAYRLLSVPLQLNNASVQAVLEDDLNQYDNSAWRLFGLVIGQPLTNKSPYVEISQTGFFTSGKSFFLIVRESSKTVDAGPGQTLKTNQAFKIPLESGHNFIANPFNFTIPVGKLRLKSGSPVTLLGYNGSFLRTETLAPWEGYYLANNRTETDTLVVDPDLSSGMALPLASSEEASMWRLQIRANCGQAHDLENFAGVAVTGVDGWDENDLAEPPPIGEYVSVYFPHAEWQKPLERYREDVRSPANSNQRWDFVVESIVHGEMVKLQFDGPREIDDALTVFLVDEEMKYKQNLRERVVYEYQSRGLDKPKRLSLVVGKEEYVSEETANTAGVPNDFVLEQNFPNPFNPETAIRFGLPQQSVVTLKIYDLAGHEVATLLDRIELPAGRHQRIWDGRDAQRRTVVSGIYFYRLVAGSFSKAMKLTVVR